MAVADLVPRPLGAVCFDCDGVILESTAIKSRAFLELFADHPQHLEAILAHHRENLGLSRFRKFEWIYRRLLGRDLEGEESRRLGERYSALVLEGALNCPLVPGAPELLAELRGRVPLFLVSGTPQEELELIVRRRRLEVYFNEVRGTPETKESILADLLRRYALAPAAVLLVGDGLSDLKAAAATGIRFVGRRTPEADSDFPTGVPVVRDLHELRAALAGAAAR